MDCKSYTNIQLNQKTGPNQVRVYSEDQIQQSATKYWQGHCRNVPRTRRRLLFLSPFWLFAQHFSEALWPVCVSHWARAPWVGPRKKATGEKRGFDDRVSDRWPEPNKLLFVTCSWGIKPRVLGCFLLWGWAFGKTKPWKNHCLTSVSTVTNWLSNKGEIARSSLVLLLICQPHVHLQIESGNCGKN